MYLLHPPSNATHPFLFATCVQRIFFTRRGYRRFAFRNAPVWFSLGLHGVVDAGVMSNHCLLVGVGLPPILIANCLLLNSPRFFPALFSGSTDGGHGPLCNRTNWSIFVKDREGLRCPSVVAGPFFGVHRYLFSPTLYAPFHFREIRVSILFYTPLRL